VLLVFLTLMGVYAFFIGFNNSGTLIAAPISTRSLAPRTAIAVAVISEFIGPFLFGSAIAATIGRDFLDPRAINLNVLMAMVLSQIVWNFATWFLGFPSSATHALVGGLSGAAFAAAGWDVFLVGGLVRIVGGLLLAPVLGLVGGYLMMKILLWLVRGASPRVNGVFQRGHVFTTAALAMSHGTNNGQQSMGVITLGLVLLGLQSTFSVPLWVIALVAAALAMGVATGGYRMIRKLGAQIYRLRPIHGFSSQGASAIIIISTALVGAPVSTTQVISTSIMGVGAAQRLRGVRWGVAGQIMTAWLVTIPVVFIFSAVLYMVLAHVM
jgi:PiT family inorganic phosphate transporter